MCAGGLRSAGLARVVYSVSGDELRGFTGSEPTVGSAEVLAGTRTEVVGGVANEAGRRLHAEFW
jgi:tRNA(Arg) A34 adenosine deaminase TadA